MPDFGARLRLARERRGMSLRQVAANTKISIAVLEALEHDDVSKLPGGIFSRGFVRTYAHEVGLDPDETVHAFVERFFPEGEPEAQSAAHSDAASGPRAGVRLLGAGAVALPLAIAIVVLLVRGRRVEAPGVVMPPTSPSRTSDHPGAPPPPPQPVPETAMESATPAGAVTLDLHPSAACWISLTVDGEHQFSRVMQAGEHERRVIRRDAVVEIGNAGVLRYSINGREGRLLGAAGEVRTMKLTPSTAATFIR